MRRCIERLLLTAPVMPLWRSDVAFAPPATPETSEHPKADTGGFAFPINAPAKHAESAQARKNHRLSAAARSINPRPSRAMRRAASCRSARQNPSWVVLRVPAEPFYRAAAAKAI